jgi:hypothetical protein
MKNEKMYNAVEFGKIDEVVFLLTDKDSENPDRVRNLTWLGEKNKTDNYGPFSLTSDQISRNESEKYGIPIDDNPAKYIENQTLLQKRWADDEKHRWSPSDSENL